MILTCCCMLLVLPLNRKLPCNFWFRGSSLSKVLMILLYMPYFVYVDAYVQMYLVFYDWLLAAILISLFVFFWNGSSISTSFWNSLCKMYSSPNSFLCVAKQKWSTNIWTNKCQETISFKSSQWMHLIAEFHLQVRKP